MRRYGDGDRKEYDDYQKGDRDEYNRRSIRINISWQEEEETTDEEYKKILKNKGGEYKATHDMQKKGRIQ